MPVRLSRSQSGTIVLADMILSDGTMTRSSLVSLAGRIGGNTRSLVTRIDSRNAFAGRSTAIA